METLYASIGGLQYLENLVIEAGDWKIKEEIFLDFTHVRKLRFDTIMPRLPREEHFPSRLMILELGSCYLKEDPMPILEKLLHLKEVRLGISAFYGKKMVCSGGGFPQLQFLEINRQYNWEEWIVEKGSMPLLHTLSIERCQKLRELPDALQFIYSLKDLELDMEWKERVSVGGADYDKVQHIPSIGFHANTDEVNCFLTSKYTKSVIQRKELLFSLNFGQFDSCKNLIVNMALYSKSIG